MRKSTGTRTVETTNFNGTLHATAVWAPEHVEIADAVISGYADGHRANALDEEYTQEFGQGEVFEYELPGLRVVVLLTGGTVCTVFTISDDTASKLHRAVRKQFPVTVTYVTAEGEETVRTIEPRSLKLTKTGAVIVKALDRKSGEHRSFRLDRVLAYTVHRTRFTVRTESPAPSKTELAEAFKAPEMIRVDTDVYSTEPGTAAVLEAPETVQDLIAERFALGHAYAFVTVRPEPEPELAQVARMLLATDPESSAGLDAERELDRVLGLH